MRIRFLGYREGQGIDDQGKLVTGRFRWYRLTYGQGKYFDFYTDDTLSEAYTAFFGNVVSYRQVDPNTLALTFTFDGIRKTYLLSAKSSDSMEIWWDVYGPNFLGNNEAKETYVGLESTTVNDDHDVTVTFRIKSADLLLDAQVDVVVQSELEASIELEILELKEDDHDQRI